MNDIIQNYIIAHRAVYGSDPNIVANGDKFDVVTATGFQKFCTLRDIRRFTKLLQERIFA